MKDKTITIHLNPSELDTVIAALRLWQAAANQESAGGVEIDSEQYEALVDLSCEHDDALTVGDIDKLVERINCPPEHEDPVVVIEGGIVQSVFLPIPDGTRPCTDIAYSLIDYDVLKEEMDFDDILAKWNSFSPALQNYLVTHCSEEFNKYFADTLEEACDCDDRSWRGPEHDSACPVKGQR
jgi:hypothetical protein